MKITKIAHHRNGVQGESFNVVLFSDKDIKNGLAIVFDAPYHIAVLDIDLLSSGVIEFGENSWRGDWYDQDIRTAIKREEDIERLSWMNKE